MTTETREHYDKRAVKDCVCSYPGCGQAITRGSVSGRCRRHVRSFECIKCGNPAAKPGTLCKRCKQHAIAPKPKHSHEPAGWRSPKRHATPLPDGSCVHWWLLGAPVNGVERGTCKKCGAVRDYDTWAGEDAGRMAVAGRNAKK